MNFTVGGDFFGDFFDVQEYRSPWKFTYWVDQILNLDDMVPAFTWQPSSAQKADSFTKRGASSFVVFVRGHSTSLRFSVRECVYVSMYGSCIFIISISLKDISFSCFFFCCSSNSCFL